MIYNANSLTRRMRRNDNPEMSQNSYSDKDRGTGNTITISRRAWFTLALLSSTLLTVFFSETMLLPAIPEIIQDFNVRNRSLDL